MLFSSSFEETGVIGVHPISQSLRKLVRLCFILTVLYETSRAFCDQIFVEIVINRYIYYPIWGGATPGNLLDKKYRCCVAFTRNLVYDHLPVLAQEIQDNSNGFECDQQEGKLGWTKSTIDH